MAEDAATADAAPEEPPKAKLGLIQILAIVGLVIVTQVVMKVVLDTFFPPQIAAQSAEDAELLPEEEEEVPAEELAPANYLPLDPALVVNIQDGEQSQYLQASIQLMTRDADVYDAAKTHAPAIRSALIMLFSTIQYDSLSTVEGKQALQDSARTRIDEVLQELAGVQGIDAVYLTSMVFQ